MTSFVTFIAVVHIIAAITLIGLVLVQDTKSGGALGIGGAANANSILGATGAQSLASKLTATFAIMFAITSLALAYFASRGHQSVTDDIAPIAAPASPMTTPADPTPSTTPTENSKEKK